MWMTWFYSYDQKLLVDIGITMDILYFFGVASRLKTNLQKNSVLPIRCEDQDLEVIRQQLSYAIADFPCKYLGLPLALKKLKKEYMQSIIDPMTDQLSGWKADLLSEKKVTCAVCAYIDAYIHCHGFGLSAMGSQGNG
jgi:hypothetical protein